jgi:uncharacterized DUF497 family protein
VIFSWDDWNVDHIAKHGVTPADAEHVVRNAEAPFPRALADDKLVVWGQAEDGSYLQVIFVFRALEEIDFGSLTLEQLMSVADGEDRDALYVVHAMPLPPKMLRQYRRLRR